jgi:hypothetical protein
VIYFKTAWSGVPDLIFKLAWIFPDVIFDYSFADEDLGSHIARYVFQGINILQRIIPKDLSIEAYEMAFSITQTMPEDNELIYDPVSRGYIINKYDLEYGEYELTTRMPMAYQPVLFDNMVPQSVDNYVDRIISQRQIYHVMGGAK